MQPSMSMERWCVMVRPMQTVKVYGVQDRRTTTQSKLPWVVRYTIDGRHRSKSYRTPAKAERYRSVLLQEGSCRRTVRRHNGRGGVVETVVE